MLIRTLVLLLLTGCLYKKQDISVSFSNMPKSLSGLRKMRLLKGGSFVMGDGRTVRLSPFYMDEHPVTNRDFEVYVAEGGQPTSNWYDPNYRQRTQPVTGLSWYQAADYCNWRSLKEGFKPAYQKQNATDAWGYPIYALDTTSDGFRLPTEAQFEYAATCGEPKPYPWGQDFDGALANMDSEQGTLNGNWWRPASVESQYQSGCGLSGMSGNVWQWCNDWYGTDKQTNDPLGVEIGRTKAKRGGSWGSPNPEQLKTTARSFAIPSSHNFETGFRCVKPMGNKKLESEKITVIEKVSHQFWKPELPQQQSKDFDVYGDAFVSRLAAYISETYPEALFFQVDIDQQPKTNPQELAALLTNICRKHKINPAFLVGIMSAQSGFGSCSFPRWFNNPTAVNWQLSLAENPPQYNAQPLKQNQKFKDLSENFEAFCVLINKPIYKKAAQEGLQKVLETYVGVGAPTLEALLNKVYSDLLRVSFESGDCSALIYTK
jgi:formylglycine-generating enzyme required for sulfatase activity